MEFLRRVMSLLDKKDDNEESDDREPTPQSPAATAVAVVAVADGGRWPGSAMSSTGSHVPPLPSAGT